MNKPVYSPWKVFHHREAFDALRRGEHVAPIHVQCVITNRCPHRCTFCSYRMAGYSSNETFNTTDEIPYEKLCEIVDDCQSMGVKAIEVTGGGEPAFHKQFLPFVLRILDAGIDLGLVTNGFGWSDEHVKVLSAAKWVRFSVDAGWENTYAMIRHVPPAWYGAVRGAIRAQANAPGRDKEQLIGVGFVVTKDNWTEVYEAAERAKEDGADNFRISAVFQNEGARYFDSFGAEAASLCRETEKLSDDKFHVFNLFRDRVADLYDGPPDYEQCWFSRLCTYIGADQNVYRCCVVSYNHVGLLGSIRERTFRDLWLAPETQRKLRAFNARSCPRCMFNAKNHTIAYAVEPNPPHLNFL